MLWKVFYIELKPKNKPKKKKKKKKKKTKVLIFKNNAACFIKEPLKDVTFTTCEKLT